MELHDNLYALGLQLGRDVFDDPESFRGALDDFLDEGDASTGDINLLVDAVRLGAFRSMVSILDSGADAPRAIEEAGNRLARDRGSADVAGAQWACAVLGFAVGKIGDADVRRYRTQTPGRSTQTPPVAETMLPSTPPTAGPPPAGPTAIPGTPGTPYPSQQAPGGPSGVPPTQTPWSSQPGPGQPVPPGQSQGAPGWSSVPGPVPGAYVPGGGLPPKKKSKTVPIVIAVVAVLAVIAGIGVVIAVTAGDDGGDDPTAEKSDSPTEDPTDFDAVNERYSELSSLITTGMDECAEGDTSSGQEENLVCTYGDGELTLITYSSAEELQAGRTREVDLSQIGGRYFDSGSGVVYSFKPDNDTTDSIDAPFLYWDNASALQAARYQANVGVEVEKVVATYESTQPSIAYPTEATDADLKAFAEKFVKLANCQRINTFTAGEVEEISCSAPKRVTPYFGKFETITDLKAYRKIKAGFAKEDRTKNRTWNLDGVTVGSLFDYTIDDDGRAARYWDDPKCLCYGEAYQEDGNATALDNWWSS